MWRIGTKSSHIWRISAKSAHLWKIGIKSSHVKKLYQNWHVWITGTKSSHNIKIVIKLSQMWRTGTGSLQMSVTKLWRIGIECKMQQIKDCFINVRNTHVCHKKIDYVRIFHQVWDIGVKYVTYWYQFLTCCLELVPNPHSVKFAKSEICGSTRLRLKSPSLAPLNTSEWAFCAYAISTEISCACQSMLSLNFP